MRLQPKGRVVFKRLEKDEELRRRIRAEQNKRGQFFMYGDEITHAKGDTLDYWATVYDLQRRIVEDVA